jgi:hypothetical protein
VTQENPATHENPAAPVSVLLTQVATAQALAATCALYKIKATAVPSPIGAYAVAHSDNPTHVTFMARQLTSLVKEVPAILITFHDGQMKAVQWEAGEEVGPLSPAIVLDGAPHELENVLFGSISPADVDGAVDSTKLSRFKAMRTLAAVAKAYKAKAEK